MTHQTFQKPEKKKRKQIPYSGDPLLEPWAVGKKLGMVTPEIYAEVVERSGGVCEICGDRAEEVHHKAGRKRRAHKDNLIHLCVECHRGKNGVHSSSTKYDKVMLDYQLWCKNKGYNEEDIRYLLGTKDGKLF